MSPAIITINEVPAFITPEEHRERTAATPASFSDIPPVVQHKEENVQVELDPLVPEYTEEELKSGTLYILESILAFISSSSGRGFKVEYPSIILHAVSRDASKPHIYCQLADPGPLEGSEKSEDEEPYDTCELKLIPRESLSLDKLFDALSHCAALHPDPATGSDLDDDDMGLGDGDDNAFVDADVETIQALAAQGVDAEPELSEAGRVRSDFVIDARYKPY